jgi:beta-lactam-binding protein with PASTA domain
LIPLGLYSNFQRLLFTRYTVIMAKRSSGSRFVLANKFFWIGLGFLALVGFGFYLLFNNILLPSYTRQGVTVTVPDVRNKSYQDAARILTTQNLEVERVVERFNPRLPRDVVIDQTPGPDAIVKPGRHVFVTVNSGQALMVKVPRVRDLSLREAENRLKAVGLNVEDLLPDTIPSPYPNTITRQNPAPGDSLPQGAGVQLWYSTGLGQIYVQVPDLIGLTVTEARQQLLDLKLRPVVVGEPEEEAVLDEQEVRRQSREPGSEIREGSEVRIFTEDAEEVDIPPPLEQQELEF